MNKNPLVTLIIPTKNCADSIKEVLYSVKLQDYKDFEIIVVDSSDDDTFKIASSFGVKIVRCASYGLTTARNIGIKNSSGSIICFTDGDCTMEKNWVSKFVSEFTKNGQIGCVGGSVLVEGKSFLGRYHSEAFIPIYPIYSKHSLIKKADFFEQPFGGTRFPAGCNIAFTKEALLNVGGFNEKWTNAWDEFEVLNRLLEKGYLISINPDIVVHHAPRHSLIKIAHQTYSYGFGAGKFTKTYQKSQLKKRISFTLHAALRTFPHSANIFRKYGKIIAFAYPFLDLFLGISYYVGFVRAYTQEKTQTSLFNNSGEK